jgi:hypothetical protein
MIVVNFSEWSASHVELVSVASDQWPVKINYCNPEAGAGTGRAGIIGGVPTAATGRIGGGPAGTVPIGLAGRII